MALRFCFFYFGFVAGVDGPFCPDCLHKLDTSRHKCDCAACRRVSPSAAAEDAARRALAGEGEG